MILQKILFVATYGDFFSSFQIDNMKLWESLGCEVHCAANFDEARYNRFTEKIDLIGVKKHNIQFTRSPFTIQIFSLYKKLKKLMIKEEINILDTHNPFVSVLSRLAAEACGIDKVIYTVHGFFFYEGCPLKYKLIYKPIEHFMAKYTDALIVTNLEDYKASKKMNVRGNTYYVPGVGVDIDKIRNININKLEKRKEIGISSDAFLLASVGECIKRKNHEAAIRAFARAKIQNAYYIIIGDGQLLEYLKSLTKELKVEDKVIFLGYRSDANEILKCVDLYVFPSFQEGLSVALLEAMASGLPIIASDIRGNRDCIVDGRGGYLFDPNNIDEISIYIKKIYTQKDKANLYGRYNYYLIDKFGKKVVKDINRRIFSKVLGEEDNIDMAGEF